MQINIREISETADKIIDTIEKDHNKFKKAETFFDFYLPATVKILNRYDEIENQRLISKDSREFMQKTQKQIAEVNIAFKKQLSSLYQSDIVDTDAELKVLDMMLKSEGYDSSNLDIEDK